MIRLCVMWCFCRCRVKSMNIHDLLSDIHILVNISKVMWWVVLGFGDVVSGSLRHLLWLILMNFAQTDIVMLNMHCVLVVNNQLIYPKRFGQSKNGFGPLFLKSTSPEKLLTLMNSVVSLLVLTYNLLLWEVTHLSTTSLSA